MTPLRVVIVGGGSSGWMAAAAFTCLLPPSACTVRLIESDEIGIVGVGEATLPHVRYFFERLGIDEPAFVAATEATMKLGIEFVGWGAPGDSYIHPFGGYGRPIAGAEFQHAWARGRRLGIAKRLEPYSFAVAAARAGRFARPSPDRSDIRSTFDYAYQFDATLYARFLRAHAEGHGLRRTEGRVVAVTRDATSGDIASVTLASGEVVAGDLFIDCSGFRALLIGETLASPWQDWTHLLPCDRAMAVPCANTGPLHPYTKATARAAGWQWTIPLQHRTGNGYVYSSALISDDAAAATLLANLPGPALAEPRPLRFRSGRRTASWTGNCVAVGLASGFLEPLESTSLYLAQIAVTTLLDLWPGSPVDPRLRAEFNRRIDREYDRVRDFLVLHYHATSGYDTDLWRHVRTMTLPDSLAEKIELFRATAHVTRYHDGLFAPESWLAVFEGQGIVPTNHSRIVDGLEPDALARRLGEIEREVATALTTLPSHDDHLRGLRAAAA
ncbi:MAG: tryptophan 7-halogenase [Sphingomonadaceae bacterium]|nr:tryptophan 7-halogenase [Sphingomonadaceae bacterium]